MSQTDWVLNHTSLVDLWLYGFVIVEVEGHLVNPDTALLMREEHVTIQIGELRLDVVESDVSTGLWTLRPQNSEEVHHGKE